MGEKTLINRLIESKTFQTFLGYNERGYLEQMIGEIWCFENFNFAVRYHNGQYLIYNIVDGHQIKNRNGYGVAFYDILECLQYLKYDFNLEDLKTDNASRIIVGQRYLEIINDAMNDCLGTLDDERNIIAMSNVLTFVKKYI